MFSDLILVLMGSGIVTFQLIEQTLVAGNWLKTLLQSRMKR